MRATFSIFLSALLICGCSQKHAAHIDESIDIVAGKDIALLGGGVLNVKKRDGSSLEGIRIVRRAPDGKETIITADTGTVTEGPKQSIEETPTNTKTQDRLRVIVVRNTVTITLFNANMLTKTQIGTTTITTPKIEFTF